MLMLMVLLGMVDSAYGVEVNAGQLKTWLKTVFNE